MHIGHFFGSENSPKTFKKCLSAKNGPFFGNFYHNEPLFFLNFGFSNICQKNFGKN